MRLRVLPLLIVTAMVMLGLRVGDIWQGFGGIAVAQSEATDPSAFFDDPFRSVQLTQAEAEADANADDGEARGEGGQAGAEGEGQANGTDQAATESAAQRRTADEPFERGVDPLDMTDAEIQVLQQLAERRKELDRREAQLEEREQMLQAAEKRLNADIAQLESLKGEIESLLIQYDEQEQKQLNRLVNIYSNMDAEDAAQIFENLDMTVLLKVVDRMNERRTAPILAEMGAEKAQALTLELAKRQDLPVPDVQN